eukprot:6111484-Pyramimonas_sp.AAC.1
MGALTDSNHQVAVIAFNRDLGETSSPLKKFGSNRARILLNVCEHIPTVYTVKRIRGVIYLRATPYPTHL